MGGSGSKPEAPNGARGSMDSAGATCLDKPFFFLASCPDDQTREALELVNRYGGFHCLADEGPEDLGPGGAGATQAPGERKATDPHVMAAWRGRTEAQFATLRQMSPKDRKVIGVAIAGFGICNDQREFLGMMSKRRNNQQFELKQCGDARDMERWLRSEGYIAALADYESANANCTGFACGTRRPPLSADAPSREFPEPPTAFASHAETQAPQAEQRVGLWGSLFGTTAIIEASRQERVMADVGRTLDEFKTLDKESKVEELREGESKLQAAINEAKEAGVATEELEEAEERKSELGILAQNAGRKGLCAWPWCCCCCKSSKTSRAEETALLESHVADSEADSPSTQMQQDRLKFLEREVRLIEEQMGQLPNGAKCLYNSSSLSGPVRAVVNAFNRQEGTYDLDVRKHAQVENISPLPTAMRAEAWPTGSTVSYQSDSAGGQFISAVIRGFNDSVDGGDVTYDLDVKRRAACSRMRPRLA